MIYIVSGYMRCGTSMMMRMLEAGGMDAVYSSERDKSMNKRWGDDDYVPNDKYMELDREDYQAPDFPAKYEGRMIKTLLPGALNLPASHQYHIVIMRRPAKQIHASLSAFFGKVNVETAKPEEFEGKMDRWAHIMRDRRSILSVQELHYPDVAEDPVRELSKLSKDVWPIDIDRAAAVFDKQKFRFAA